MGKNVSLSSQTKYANIVIEYNVFEKHCNFSKLGDGLESSGFIYAFILHDKDTNSDGTLKHKHIHLTIVSPKRHRLDYYLRIVGDICNIENLNAIQVTISNGLDVDLQYLVHKNSENKYHYDELDIHTNLDDYLYQEYMNREILVQLDIDNLIKIIYDTNFVTWKIIKRVGLNNYNTYRNTIKDLIQTLDR